ncbi:MAG TPA: FUSC family protein [Streptosporangiaceae bacterium]
MSGAIRHRERTAQIGIAARTLTERAPVTLTLVRQRAWPTAETIVRLTVTAVFAYLLALLIPSTPRPVLAPLTALLVVQASIYQTLRSAVRRVASVVAGVLLALGLSAWVGFTWWSLGIAITLGLTVGYALHLREQILEVPVSAMLIMSVGTRSAATGRIVETFIGTAAGLVAGFVLTSPQVQPAEQAIEELCGTMAGLLDRMTAGLRDEPVQAAAATGWLAQARSLGTEILRVDDALRQAEESTKLNPRSLRLPHSAVTLREHLETLEHEAIVLRALARALADSTRLADHDNPVNDQDVRHRLAGVLAELGSAVRTYGSLATELDPPRHEQLQAELKQHLAAAHEKQDRLSALLDTDPSARPVGWPLRGELISHLDRFRTELEAGQPDGSARPRRNRLQLPSPVVGQRLPHAWRRLIPHARRSI